jgi:LDH2 family malate/lactate/ureidoglycolate dehydrogenase
MLMDTLAGALSGARFGMELQRMPDSDPRSYGIGHFLMAIDPSWFGDVAEFRVKIDRMIRDLRGTPTQEGVDRIYAPGERSHEKWLAAQRDGVTLSEQLLRTIRELAASG